MGTEVIFPVESTEQITSKALPKRIGTREHTASWPLKYHKQVNFGSPSSWKSSGCSYSFNAKLFGLKSHQFQLRFLSVLWFPFLCMATNSWFTFHTQSNPCPTMNSERHKELRKPQSHGTKDHVRSSPVHDWVHNFLDPKLFATQERKSVCGTPCLLRKPDLWRPCQEH